MIRFTPASAQAPPRSGAYVLLVSLRAPLRVAVGRRRALLEAGDYLYCGSARGPGGLRGRIARHMRRDKRAHWHIDQLTAAGQVLGAWIDDGGDECALNSALDGLPIPLDGFGSSDCPRCRAHLRRLTDDALLPSAWESARKAAESPPPP